MKTIRSKSAQKANMKSSQKTIKTTSPSNQPLKNGKETTSGKKLVQARLPFKILAGTPSVKPDKDAVTSSSGTIEILSKKRKLSYTEEPENEKKIGKSDSKENTTTLENQDSPSEVIELDDESEEESSQNVSSPKTSAAAVVTSHSNKNKITPRNTSGSGSGSASKPKLQIKLPLSGKKKRKSKRTSRSMTNAEASDSSDVELVSDEQLQNPQKRLKLEELQKQKDEDVQKQQPISSKSVEADHQSKENEVKINISRKTKEKTSPKSNNDKKVDLQLFMTTEPNPQTPKTSKQTRSTVKNQNSLKEGSNYNDPNETESSSKLQSGSSKNNSPQKLDNSLKENDDKKELEHKSSKEDAKKTTPLKTVESSSLKDITPLETSPKDTSAKQQSSSPTKELKTSRRSIRISESDKNKKEDSHHSSDPELVMENTNAVDTSINKEIRNKLLTPKQQKLMEQRKKAREEKELKLQQLKEERERKLQELREERDRKIQEEKMQKQKEREERESQRKKEREEKEEQKRREREEKEDQRRKEKEDKERKRLAEIEAKNEEKRKKDEVKEEERRRKELEKEEEENKKKKAAQAFTKFFVPKAVKTVTDEDQESRDDSDSVDSLAFRPFQIKGDMKLAPFVRREFKECSVEKLDSFLKSSNTNKSALYINELKSGAHIPMKGSKTVLKNNDDEDDDDDDVVLITSELENAAQTIDEPRDIPIQTYKAKYYLFRENRRPPFHGTWRKTSTVITPRKPFAMDKTFFDYDVDSDEEWEEEEPGESLTGSDDEKDESEDEDYEVDNEWFVPHGHLSDEEMQNEDELGPDTSREAQKAKLKALQQEFAQEMKKKTEKIKPRLIGTIWEDENGNRPKLCPTIIWDSLCTRAMMLCEPILMEEPEIAEPEPSTPPAEKRKRIELNEELMKDLVRLVHGNRHSRVFLIKEYLEHVSNTCEIIKTGECLAPTKSQIKEKIDEISEWSVVNGVNKKNKNRKKLCWVVAADILDKYGLANLKLRNEWSYKLQPKYDKDLIEPANEIEKECNKTETPEDLNSSKIDKKKTKLSGITKFTKVFTKEEKEKQQTATECISFPKSTTKSYPKVLKTSASPKSKESQKSNIPAPKTSSPSTVVNKNPAVKKRVALLMSVPPGQQFSPQSKNALISKFLQKNKAVTTVKSMASTDTEKSSNLSVSMDVDEVVVLD